MSSVLVGRVILVVVGFFVFCFLFVYFFLRGIGLMFLAVFSSMFCGGYAFYQVMLVYVYVKS